MQVVRVAVSNNFNCTPLEWKQLDHFAKWEPDRKFFVNCNIRTPLLETVVEHPYPSVVTANPDLSGSTDMKKLKAIRTSLAFARLKVVPDSQDINLLGAALLDAGIPVVVTIQRFNSLDTLKKHADPALYEFRDSRWRLKADPFMMIRDRVARFRDRSLNIWVCDERGTGCQDCRLCSKLTYGAPYDVASLNLSGSGLCRFSCPDCYAKRMQEFCRSMGHAPVEFDVIKKNDKQAGRTKHIIHAKEAACRS